MQKSFKLILTLLCTVLLAFASNAQEKTDYKDVLLDGKPAKLNIKTGEITVVVSPDIITKTPGDSIKRIKDPIAVNDSLVTIDIDKNLKASESDDHIVKKGETLFQISNRYKVSLSDLKKFNNLETTLITIGQKLRVRNFNEVSTKPRYWIVKKGDNLYRIALKTNTTVQALKQRNGLTSDMIKIGQKLQLD